jgi:hypothetical protein
MRVVRRPTQETDEPPRPARDHPPARLPQRWVVILGFAATATLALSLTIDVTLGVGAGLTLTGLLHAIMD